MNTIADSATQAPSSPHAPDVHSESCWQLRHVLFSQIAFVGIGQSADTTHSTHDPVDVSHVGDDVN
jgi:hypothetical protein